MSIREIAFSETELVSGGGALPNGMSIDLAAQIFGYPPEQVSLMKKAWAVHPSNDVNWEYVVANDPKLRVDAVKYLTDLGVSVEGTLNSWATHPHGL